MKVFLHLEANPVGSKRIPKYYISKAAKKYKVKFKILKKKLKPWRHEFKIQISGKEKNIKTFCSYLRMIGFEIREY